MYKKCAITLTYILIYNKIEGCDVQGKKKDKKKLKNETAFQNLLSKFLWLLLELKSYI